MLAFLLFSVLATPASDSYFGSQYYSTPYYASSYYNRPGGGPEWMTLNPCD